MDTVYVTIFGHGETKVDNWFLIPKNVYMRPMTKFDTSSFNSNIITNYFIGSSKISNYYRYNISFFYQNLINDYIENANERERLGLEIFELVYNVKLEDINEEQKRTLIDKGVFYFRGLLDEPQKVLEAVNDYHSKFPTQTTLNFLNIVREYLEYSKNSEKKTDSKEVSKNQDFYRTPMFLKLLNTLLKASFNKDIRILFNFYLKQDYKHIYNQNELFPNMTIDFRTIYPATNSNSIPVKSTYSYAGIFTFESPNSGVDITSPATYCNSQFSNSGDVYTEVLKYHDYNILSEQEIVKHDYTFSLNDLVLKIKNKYPNKMIKIILQACRGSGIENANFFDCEYVPHGIDLGPSIGYEPGGKMEDIFLLRMASNNNETKKWWKYLEIMEQTNISDMTFQFISEDKKIANIDTEEALWFSKFLKSSLIRKIEYQVDKYNILLKPDLCFILLFQKRLILINKKIIHVFIGQDYDLPKFINLLFKGYIAGLCDDLILWTPEILLQHFFENINTNQSLSLHKILHLRKHIFFIIDNLQLEVNHNTRRYIDLGIQKAFIDTCRDLEYLPDTNFSFLLPQIHDKITMFIIGNTYNLLELQKFIHHQIHKLVRRQNLEILTPCNSNQTVKECKLQRNCKYDSRKGCIENMGGGFQNYRLYTTIVNPMTGRKCNIYGILGQQILQKYLQF